MSVAVEECREEHSTTWGTVRKHRRCAVSATSTRSQCYASGVSLST
jgi:hypothetical protein